MSDLISPQEGFIQWSAYITRADGTIEDLGVIATSPTLIETLTEEEVENLNG